MLIQAQRYASVGEFYGYLKGMLFHLKEIRIMGKRKLVDDKLKERIMLAVTEVNGCRYCSYAHTRMALETGISREEINSMLSGDLKEVPENEQVAILFAQHVADKQGNYDLEAYHRVCDEYGHDMALDVLSVIRIIMMGNAYGIAAEALVKRLKLHPAKGSGIFRELGILLGVIIFIPIIFIQKIFE